jgi:hypothetical protein
MTGPIEPAKRPPAPYSRSLRIKKAPQGASNVQEKWGAWRHGPGTTARDSDDDAVDIADGFHLVGKPAVSPARARHAH